LCCSVFGVVFAGLFDYDLVPTGFTGIVEFHREILCGLFSSPRFFFHAAIGKELCFARLAFGVLRKRFPLWVAVLLPAIFFGFAHMYWGIGRVLCNCVGGGVCLLCSRLAH
jgi:membrane protease YdiL (CAAX protease family)